MPVKVEFPDGITREVPSHRRELKSREIGSSNQSAFVDEPTYDPDWRFRSAIGGWVAVAR